MGAPAAHSDATLDWRTMASAAEQRQGGSAARGTRVRSLGAGARAGAVLVLVALALRARPCSAANTAAFDSSYCRNKFFGQYLKHKIRIERGAGGNSMCPLRADPVKHLQDTFERTIAGQEGALKIIRAALTKNEREQAAGAKKKPLIFHFSGPSGVGKSMTAKALSRAIMQDTESLKQAEWCGVSTINGHFYSSQDAARIEAYKSTIERDIGNQLYECPRSVVVVDDVQNMGWQLVNHLANTVFDENHPQTCYGSACEAAAFIGRGPSSSAGAIFVLVSDLGADSLAPNLTREQAKEVVREASLKRWKEWSKDENNGELPKFLRDVVPFLPLSEEDMSKVALLELQRYRNELQADPESEWGGVVSWADDVPAYIARTVTADKYLREIQGRGVQQKVLEIVDEALDEMYSSGELSRSGYDNLHLKMLGAEVTPTVERVLNRNEF